MLQQFFLGWIFFVYSSNCFLFGFSCLVFTIKIFLNTYFLCTGCVSSSRRFFATVRRDFQILVFPWVVYQIVVRILQMLLSGVSSKRRVFLVNLCETQDCSENLPETWKTKPHLSKTLKQSLALAVF